MKIIIVVLIACALLCGILWSLWFIEGQRGEQINLQGEGLLETKHDKAKKGKPMFTNELIHETSPYLLQHAHNPVDWMPWSAAAFEKAQREDKPIFLSVGYSTCHWCHVMAHESFENEEVAKILNEHFVSIKVDREELPDVDEQYMLASQLLTRRGGGWPNSVWLTPDRKPWFAGTYFPREDRGGLPGFKTILSRLAEAWNEQRPEIDQQADRMADVLRELGTNSQGPVRTAEPRPLSFEIVDNAIKTVTASYDSTHGGFGSRPKFPPHGQLSLLIYQHRKTLDSGQLGMITKTLEAMSQGGIYDHVGGGFHRYSTDERWFLPHFEKMLYDNAQLIQLYANGYELTGYEDFRRVVRETFDWITREMTDPAGGFYCALDADSLNDEGHAEEGKFYVWTPDQVIDTLGKEDGKIFNMVYGISQAGNFMDEATGQRTGDSIPFLFLPLGDMAMNMKLDSVEFREQVGQMQEKLLEQRAKRSRPHLDDKVLTSWNGLMIAGLAQAGRVFDEPAYIDAATRAADFVLKNLREEDGRLLRTWRDGRAKIPAYLDDYAFFIQGLLELHHATGDQRWLDEAVVLAELMIIDFGDTVQGGFYMTSVWHSPLLTRSTGMTGGGNLPSGNGVAARALTRLAVLTKNPSYATTAHTVFEAHANTMWDQPAQVEHLILALGEYLDLKAQGKLPELVHVDDITLDLPEGFNAMKADATAGELPVRVAAFVSHNQVKPGEQFQVAVQIQIDPPWHIYSDQPGSDVPIKTELTLTSDQATLETVHYPDSEPFKDAATGETLNTFTGRVTLLATLQLNEDVTPDEKIELVLKLKAQACDERQCLLPQEYKLPIRVSVASEMAVKD